MTLHPQRHLNELLKNFSTAMMVTRAGDRSIHARPMHIAEISEDGNLYFATSLESSKLRDIENNSDVTLIFQADSIFVSLNGTAHTSTEQDLIDRLWSEAWRVWFPEGKDDPSLVILKIEPQDAEYWDNSGSKGISYTVAALKAYVTGERPAEADKGQHAKLDL